MKHAVVQPKASRPERDYGAFIGESQLIDQAAHPLRDLAAEFHLAKLQRPFTALAVTATFSSRSPLTARPTRRHAASYSLSSARPRTSAMLQCARCPGSFHRSHPLAEEE